MGAAGVKQRYWSKSHQVPGLDESVGEACFKSNFPTQALKHLHRTDLECKLVHKVVSDLNQRAYRSDISYYKVHLNP